jgi:hypothetical protein
VCDAQSPCRKSRGCRTSVQFAPHPYQVHGTQSLYVEILPKASKELEICRKFTDELQGLY